MTRNRYIVQLLNKSHLYWFDYVTFSDKITALEFFSRIKKANANEKKVKARLIEVLQYDKKEY